MKPHPEPVGGAGVCQGRGRGLRTPRRGLVPTSPDCPGGGWGSLSFSQAWRKVFLWPFGVELSPSSLNVGRRLSPCTRAAADPFFLSETAELTQRAAA